jgi:hypothetical protein
MEMYLRYGVWRADGNVFTVCGMVEWIGDERIASLECSH